VHQLSAYDVNTGVVLFQVNVKEKQNEISASSPFSRLLSSKGGFFTLDAMHTQTELCARVDHYGGFYVLVAKDNHPLWRPTWRIFSLTHPSIGAFQRIREAAQLSIL